MSGFFLGFVAGVATLTTVKGLYSIAKRREDGNWEGGKHGHCGRSVSKIETSTPTTSSSISTPVPSAPPQDATKD